MFIIHYNKKSAMPIFENVLKEVNGVPVEDTYCELFDGIFTRFYITANREKEVRQAAERGANSLPSVVVGRTEGGIEQYLGPSETPDKRPGAVVQIWGQWIGKNYSKEKQAFYDELCLRIRQGILVVPTTKVFNNLESDWKFDMTDGVGFCGDKYSKEYVFDGNEILKIPIMMGEFEIEKYLNFRLGMSGGNLWYFCDSIKSALEVGDKVVEAIQKLPGAVTPFDSCSAGSKPPYNGQPNVSVIGPSTNHEYCPTLKKLEFSKVPAGVNSIPEIVIDALDKGTMMKAMKIGIEIGSTVNGVLGISTGNYGGKLGKYKIPLADLGI
jgi:formylmethanofuran--tetrahydromethanopterin N-formyltransferase